MGNKSDLQTLSRSCCLSSSHGVYLANSSNPSRSGSPCAYGISSTNMIVVHNSYNLDILGGVYQTQQEEMLGEHFA
jgi:hypothetical protein